MNLIAVPFRPFAGVPTKNTILLDALVALPVFSLPGTPEDKRIVAAQWLTNPDNMFWEIWRGAEFVGIFGLTKVVRGLDALAHLAFFDKKLVGKRQLILNTLAWAFRELDLQRLSLEIPSRFAHLIRFARKLGFRYEGEALAASHAVVTAVLPKAGRVNNAPQWVAHWGSRREHTYFDGQTWDDHICLRLLREEFLNGYSSGSRQSSDGIGAGITKQTPL